MVYVRFFFYRGGQCPSEQIFHRDEPSGSPGKKVLSFNFTTFLTPENVTIAIKKVLIVCLVVYFTTHVTKKQNKSTRNIHYRESAEEALGEP